MMIFAFFLALLAAFSNAASSLLQREANKQSSKRLLVLRPVWLMGFGASLVSFVLQASALGLGSLAAIEPILALELVVVVLGSGVFFRAHIGKQEWISIILMTAGIIILIAALDPQKNDRVIIPAWEWLVAIGFSIGAIGGCWAGARAVRRRGEYHAALLGIGVGMSFGLASAFLKGTMLIFKQSGLGSALASWQFYCAVAVGLFAFWLLQRALRAGKLVASQPGITLADPFIAIVWGGTVYGEQMNGGWALLVAVLGALVLTAGAILLARAPALETSQ